MTVRNAPPRAGLTRRNTGYSAWPYMDWYWTKAAVKRFERLNVKRNEPAPDLRLDGMRRERPCAACGTRIMTANPNKMFRCDPCEEARSKALTRSR